MTENGQLLMEIGCEEIPSRFIPHSMEQLKKEAAALLADSRLKHGPVETWATPRRLVILISELKDRQPDLVEKIKGPPVNRAYDESGKPTKALEGFLKSQGIQAGQLEEEEVKGSRYVIAQKETAGRDAEEILPEILPRLIQKLSFPRPMYWQSKDVRFARPIRWILALYSGKEIVFDYAGIKSGRNTYGHRFLSPGPFAIENAEQYFKCLEENHIIVDQEKRKTMIREQLKDKAAEVGGEALVDEGLLDEVTYLVEYPVAVHGSFDPAFLDLPQEVPITSMQNHQRYFPIVEKESGKLMPHFVGISNNRFHQNISKGYAKVLQARLSDGRFFFNEDRKQPLEKYADHLKSVIFLEQLGSVDDKRERLVALAGKIGIELGLPDDQVERGKRIAHLCKADLVTSMVKEFPELQGVMGREYGKLSGEAEEVAAGIYEHYQPRYAGDQLPGSIEGALVSLADRIDTLAGCFAIGIQPTGSQDPYALRRQAQGAIAIMIGFNLNLSLDKYIEFGLTALNSKVNLGVEERERVQAALYDFLLQRVRFLLQERGIDHDVAEAVLSVPFAKVSDLFDKAHVIEDYLKGPLLDDIIIAYNRVANLAQKATSSIVDKTYFEGVAEKELFRNLKTAEEVLDDLDNPEEILEQLQLLRQPIDNFFDNVMVMVEDEKIRKNRLSLLAALKATFNRFADFSKLPSP